MPAGLGVTGCFRILKALVILFFFMNNVLNQNGIVLKETLTGSNSDAAKTSLKGLCNSEMIFPFWKFLKKLSPTFCHLATYIIMYYEWLNRLRRHIQIARLPVQFPRKIPVPISIPVTSSNFN